MHRVPARLWTGSMIGNAPHKAILVGAALAAAALLTASTTDSLDQVGPGEVPEGGAVISAGEPAGV